MDAQFADAAANRSRITEQTALKTIQTTDDQVARLPVSQSINPIDKGLGFQNIDHGNVSN